MKALALLFLAPSILFAQEKKVSRIIDGNTFVTATGEKVRITGINAPGINALYGLQAKNHLQQLIGGKSVTLRADDLSPKQDGPSVILRYVYLNNTDIGERMMLEGYAITWLKYPFVKSGEYRQAQLLAQNLGFGIWHNPAYLSRVDTSEYAAPDKKTTAGRIDLSTKAFLKECFIGSIVVLLLFMGIYGYLKK